MNINPGVLPDVSRGFEIEFNALRSEVLKRIEMRQQIVSITLTLAGIFLAVGLSNSPVAFVYPSLATFLATGWAQNEIRIRQIGQYIRDRLEGALPGLGWEKYRRENEAKTRVGAWPLVILSPAGIFVFTQILAIGVGLYKFTFTTIEYVLFSFDVISVLLTFAILEYVRRSGRP